jgi:hypothetical protein
LSGHVFLPCAHALLLDISIIHQCGNGYACCLQHCGQRRHDVSFNQLRGLRPHMRAEIRRFSKAPPISRDLQMTGSGADQAPSIRRSP